jgi:hypothetical protein
VRSFVLPGETPLPNAAISDTGKLVKYLVENGDKYHKRTIAFNSQSISELDKLKVLEKGKKWMQPTRHTRDWQPTLPAYNIPVRYQQTPQHEFRQSLEAAMGPVTALDFTEQLMIYDNADFVQASQVRDLHVLFH